ncbi:Zn-ribbon domain-containing OB-fold protein [Acuticoccus kandeliae]|uniref:Zn-ribbon domain-containing OB-fold protein n=1 Tax=Acuticoccus kandeliae TaxID=2073160 RepID=UPI001300500D|nr:hypothetical protein [Acuticoccus kandeliae]
MTAHAPARGPLMDALDRVAIRGGPLRLPLCDHCGEIAWPPRPVCGRCHALDRPAWTEIGADGRVQAVTLLHDLPRAHAMRLPVPIATVHLDFGGEVIAFTHVNVTYGDRVAVRAELDRSGRAVLVAAPRGSGQPSAAEVRESLGLAMTPKSVALYGTDAQIATILEGIGCTVFEQDGIGTPVDGALVLLRAFEPIEVGARDARFGDLLLATERMADHLRAASAGLLKKAGHAPVTLIAAIPDGALAPLPGDGGGAAAAAAAFSLVASARQRLRPHGVRVVTLLYDDSAEAEALAMSIPELCGATREYAALGPRAEAALAGWSADPLGFERVRDATFGTEEQGPP